MAFNPPVQMSCSKSISVVPDSGSVGGTADSCEGTRFVWQRSISGSFC